MTQYISNGFFADHLHLVILKVVRQNSLYVSVVNYFCVDI